LVLAEESYTQRTKASAGDPGLPRDETGVRMDTLLEVIHVFGRGVRNEV